MIKFKFIYHHKSDGYYYLSTNSNVQNFQKGLICSHHHHERQTFVFSSRTDIDEHVDRMVKQFAMKNYFPSTCVRMLHRMDDRLYDVKTVVNIFNNAKKSLLEEKGVDTSSTKAQQLVDYLMTNTDTNAVIVIHDPSSALIGGRQKGRPKKKSENHLVLLMKMSNKEVSVEELVFDRDYTVDDYAQAHRHALYLPYSDSMLLYVALCTTEELWMENICGSFWTLDTTSMMNIEDRSLMKLGRYVH
jgi:predicted house-cleaning NTP pyrophosphatase (Maf/HAM1 superfamily)